MRGGAGLVFLLLAVFFGLMVANLVLTPYEQLVAHSKESGQSPNALVIERQIVNFARPVIAWALRSDDAEGSKAQYEEGIETQRWVSYLLDERPALLSAILLVLIFGMPLLIPFGAFNQTAGEIGNRGLRYLLQRTERANIYYGRLLATMALTVAVQALVIFTIALYLGFKVQIYGGMDIVIWSSLGFLALAVLSLPYVALCAWVSASFDSGLASLAIGNLVIGGVLLAAFLAGLAWEPAHYLDYLLPWGIQNHLLGPDFLTVVLTVAGCLGYTVVFAWLGARKFEKRDL